jgi:hypothetical protein
MTSGKFLSQDEVDLLLFGYVEPLIPLTEEEVARGAEAVEGLLSDVRVFKIGEPND